MNTTENVNGSKLTSEEQEFQVARAMQAAGVGLTDPWTVGRTRVLGMPRKQLLRATERVDFEAIDVEKETDREILETFFDCDLTFVH